MPKINCRFCLSLSGFVCVMDGNLLRGLRDMALFDACLLARCGSCSSKWASMNFSQVFRSEKPYVFISRLSRGCHQSLGCVAPLVSQLPAFQTRASHLFWCAICTICFPSSLVDNHDGLTFISFSDFSLNTLHQRKPAHGAHPKQMALKLAQTDVKEQQNDPIITGSHLCKCTSGRKQLFCYRRNILQWNNVMLFFSDVWKAFCLCACD